MSEQKYEFDPVFDLNRDMLELIFDNFNVEKLVDDFKKEMEKKDGNETAEIAQKIFKKAGESLTKNAIKIADKEENRDRGYQILREYCMRPENEPFPHLLQRFIEVIYLSINPKLPEVGLLESSRAKLSYWIDEDDCLVYKTLKDKCGEELLTTMPCRHLCLNMLNELAKSWGVKDYEIDMESMMTDNQLCKFNIRKPGVKLPKVPIMRWEE